MLKTEAAREFLSFAWKIIVTHTVSYFIFGLLMSYFFDYGKLFQQEIIRDYMRPIGSSYVLAGPFLQPIRGLLFSFGIWPLRNFIIQKKYGWLILWNIIIMFGIFSTPAAAPCSVEGLLYSKLPLWYHIIGLPEILLQTLTFSLVLIWWLKRSTKDSEVREYSKKRSLITFVTIAIMIACFGYIGYAIGAILTALIAGVEINLKEASLALKSQMMFVVAFLVNVLSILLLTKYWLMGKMKISMIFFIFWFVDTLVLLLYQAIFLSPMPLHLAMLIGLFPATIITFSLYLNRKNLIELDIL